MEDGPIQLAEALDNDLTCSKVSIGASLAYHVGYKRPVGVIEVLQSKRGLGW